MWTQRDWDIFAQHWVERKRSYWQVSPSEYADHEFMAWLYLNFPNGRLVWRTHCDGCLLCEK